MISVYGKLNTRKYTDKQGQVHYITEIVAQKIDQINQNNYFYYELDVH